MTSEDFAKEVDRQIAALDGVSQTLTDKIKEFQDEIAPLENHLRKVQIMRQRLDQFRTIDATLDDANGVPF